MRSKPVSKPTTKRSAEFVCNFCKTRLTTESYLLNHVCEQKRRWLHRDDKVEKLAFTIFHHFIVKSMARHTAPTHESFARNTLYRGFVRFARYVIDIEAINLMGFVDFLLRLEFGIDEWINPHVYGRYIRELNKNETPLEAITRNFMLMEQWSVATGEKWSDFFRCIAPPQATLWIINGRISPWLLFTAPSALNLLQRLNKEQEQMIERTIDSEFWQAKLARHQENVAMIRSVLEENNI